MKLLRIYKGAIWMGLILLVFDIIWNLLTESPAYTEDVLRILLYGLFSGCISALLYFVLMYFTERTKYFQDSITIDLEEGEEIRFSSPANHCKKAEIVGGRLFLTNHRIFFKSNSMNYPLYELSVPITDIQTVERFRPLAIASNGLLITTNINEKEKFVVMKAESWRHHLQAMVVNFQSS